MIGASFFSVYFFSSFSGGTRGCAACAAHSASRFFRRFFVITTAVPPACREQQNDRPEHDDAENERADRIDQTARAGLCRLRQLRAEAAALGGGGQSLHLIERDGKGREADQIVIMTLGAGQRVDLIFAVRERVFERNDVLHFARLDRAGASRRSCLVWSVASRVSMSGILLVMSSLERDE